MRLIDADALMEEIESWDIDKDEMESDGDRCYHQGITRALRVVGKAPTVDAEPVRHGYWIDIDQEQDTMLRECSVCRDQQVHWNSYYPNCCSNCGTKMDGGKTND